MTAQLGVCPQLRGKLPKTEFIADIQSYRHTAPPPNIFVRPPSKECTNDNRPMFLFIEGGVHYTTQGPLYIDSYLRPALQAIHQFAEQCHAKSKEHGQEHPIHYKLHIAVSGVAFTSDEVVRLHGHQNAAQNAKFHREVNEFLTKEFPRAVLLDFVALTREGTLAGRGDGFHILADINLIKAQIALNAMKLFLKHEHHHD